MSTVAGELLVRILVHVVYTTGVIFSGLGSSLIIVVNGPVVLMVVMMVGLVVFVLVVLVVCVLHLR